MAYQGSAELAVDFAGELHTRLPGEKLTVGRTADVAIDDNPYLHRELLVFDALDHYWWVHNVGTHLPVHVADRDGYTRTVLGPGAHLPLVHRDMLVTFAAGGTDYELIVRVGSAPEVMRVPPPERGARTVLPSELTDLQLLALVALAEPVLRRTGSGGGQIPSSPQAAARIGWTVKRFDKKIENLCDKLAGAGVPGLRGHGERVATHRRRNLVEYAVAVRLVTPRHLALLDAALLDADRLSLPAQPQEGGG